jgi:hypothetical protein
MPRREVLEGRFFFSRYKPLARTESEAVGASQYIAINRQKLNMVWPASDSAYRSWPRPFEELQTVATGICQKCFYLVGDIFLVKRSL